MLCLLQISLPILYRNKFSPHQPALGASGAVNAVVTLSCASFPMATVYLWGILPIPSAVFGVRFSFQNSIVDTEGLAVVAFSMLYNTILTQWFCTVLQHIHWEGLLHLQ